MDIRSNLHSRMRTLKEKKDVKIDYKKIPAQVSKAVVYSIRYSYRTARSYPFLTGLALFLLLLYSYLPSLFSFLISSSPVIICTTLLLGTLLSYGEPYIPEIDEEEMKMSHDVSSQQICGASDDLITKKDEEFITESVVFSERDAEGDPTMSLQVDNENVVPEHETDPLQIRGVSTTSKVILEEDNIVVESLAIGNKREIEEDTTKPHTPFHGFPDVNDIQKDGAAFSMTEKSLDSKKDAVEIEDSIHIQVVDATTEISVLQPPVLTAEVKKETTSTGSTSDWDKKETQSESGERIKGKDPNDDFFEKIYVHEEMLAEDASVGTESVPDFDSHAQEDMVYVKAETDGTTPGICYYSLLSTKKPVDGTDDSGSDVAESSSSDASMADIIPMLDELRPFLDADLSRPVHIDIDGDDDNDADEDDDDDDASEQSSHDSKSESGCEEHVAEDHSHLVTQKEKPTESEFMLSWTPDDEKNLMDLGSSELERNQRLENMIAKRRARKDLENSIGLRPFHADAALTANALAHLCVQVPPISVRRNNPFDYHYDSEEMKGLPPIPGSAPSVFSRRRNPFEFPYWEVNDIHNTTGDGLRPPEFASQKEGTSSESFGGFTYGPSSSGDSKEVKPDSNVAPHFSTAKTEPVTLSKYERQLSRLSDPRLSSISEPESISPVVQGCDEEVPLERDSLEENHMFSAANHDEDFILQSKQEDRNIDFSSIKESLGVLTRSELARNEIVNKLEPVISDTPLSTVVEGECDESDASTNLEEIISAKDQEICIDPLSTKPYLFTESSASLDPASQESDAPPDNLGLSDQDLNSADKDFIVAHRSIEGSTPYDIENLSKDDAAWLREIAEMRKLDLSGKIQGSQAEGNIHFASISSTEPESYEQLQVNTVQKLDVPTSYLQELTSSSLASCASEYPCLSVDEPVPLPSYSCSSESRMDILQPIPEEIAADSNHEEHHNILVTVMEKSNGLSSDDSVAPSHSVEPFTLLPNDSPPAASLKLETWKDDSVTTETVNDGSVNLSINELKNSQLLDIQSYTSIIGSGGQFSDDPVGNVDDATTTVNEVKELDEGLLSELDVVGDFSIQNLSSSETQCSNKSILYGQSGNEMPSSVIFIDDHAISESQALNTDVSQINCRVSPLPENEISVPTKEYDDDDLRLMDSSFEHHYIETTNVEDITSVLQEPDGNSDRNIILDSTTDYGCVSQAEFGENGIPAKLSNAPEDKDYNRKMEFHSDIHEVEAESIDDIHRALQNFAGANQFLTKQPTDMQFTSSLPDAEAHNLECTGLAVEQLSGVRSSHTSLQDIQDINICLHEETRSPEIIHATVKHQAECTSNGAEGKLEGTFPSLMSSGSSLNKVEISVEDSHLSTKHVLFDSVVIGCGQHEVEETPLKDAATAKRQDGVDSVPAVTADPDNSGLELLENVLLTARQKEISSEPAASCSVLLEVEECSPEDAILVQDAYSESVTSHSVFSKAEELSVKEEEFAFSQQEQHTDKVIIHSEMHEVEAQSVDDLHALFRQHGAECEYGIIHSEPHEVEEHSAENLGATKLNLDFSVVQEDRWSNEAVEHSDLHEIEAQSLEDLHTALTKQVYETKSETGLHEIETKSVDELPEEIQNLHFVLDPDTHSGQIGGYSEIHEIEAQSLDDLHAAFGKHSEEHSPAIDSEPRGFEAPSESILVKEVTTLDLVVEEQKLAQLVPQHVELNEVEPHSLGDLHIVLQQQDVIAKTVICSEPVEDELRTAVKALEKETTDRDSASGPEKQSKEMDEEQFSQFDVPVEREMSSGSFVHSDMHEIEAHSLDDLHQALSPKTMELDKLEKAVNQPESQSDMHEIEAGSLDDLHLALGKWVMPSNSSHILSGEHELEAQPLGKGNMHSASAEAQVDLHEIEVHSLDDLHLALGKQGMLSALTQKEQEFETQSLGKENTCSESLDLHDIGMRSLDSAPLEPSFVQSDLQKVEAQPPESERKILDSAAVHLELHEIKAQSTKDIYVAFEQFMESASTGDEHVGIKQTENLSNQVISSSGEVCLPEAESCNHESQVEFVENEAVSSNLDASSTKLLDEGKPDDSDSGSSSSSSNSD